MISQSKKKSFKLHFLFQHLKKRGIKEGKVRETKGKEGGKRARTLQKIMLPESFHLLFQPSPAHMVVEKISPRHDWIVYLVHAENHL